MSVECDADFANLERELPRAEPYLFNLADQLVSQDTDRWNLIVVDDIGGRLPAAFMRPILRAHGFEMPMVYVAGNGDTRKRLGTGPYEKYFHSLQEKLGNTLLHPLLFTESVGEGEAIGFLQSALQSSSAACEVATVANRKPDQNRPDYVGGHGNLASDAVYYAFENIANTSLKGRASRLLRRSTPRCIKDALPRDVRPQIIEQPRSLLNIQPSIDSEIPVSVRRAGNRKTAASYRLMSELAVKYLSEREAR